MKLLLLHPLPLDGSVFPEGLRSLADEAVAPTLYGVGDDITGWARAALDLVGDGPVVIVGNSVGGSCGIEVARLAPKKVTALVLCGSKPGHRPEPRLRDEALQVIARDGLHAAWQRYWLPLFGPKPAAGVVERAWHIASNQGADAVATGVRAFHGRPDGDDFLRSWPGPVRLVSGEHDIRPERSRRLAEALPNAKFHLVDDVGHYVPLEAPDALTAITAEALVAAR